MEKDEETSLQFGKEGEKGGRKDVMLDIFSLMLALFLSFANSNLTIILWNS